MKQGIIVCAFPATGKTTAIEMAQELEITTCDSDSEDHHWTDRSVLREDRVERPNWVLHYLGHLAQKADTIDFVFCSTHELVRRALETAGAQFVCVYPTTDQKDEFLRRVNERTTELHGEQGKVILDRNWDLWLGQMQNQEGCRHVVLQPGKYLSDVLDEIREAAAPAS